MLGVKQQQLAQEFFDPFLLLHCLMSDMVELIQSAKISASKMRCQLYVPSGNLR